MTYNLQATSLYTTTAIADGSLLKSHIKQTLDRIPFSVETYVSLVEKHQRTAFWAEINAAVPSDSDREEDAIAALEKLLPKSSNWAKWSIVVI